MTSRGRALATLALMAGLALALIAIAGVAVDSSWVTFVPDLIIGLLTAGGVAGFIAVAQFRAEARRGEKEARDRAYEDLLDSLADLQLAALTDRDTTRLMSRVGVKMITLVEREDKDDSDLAAWFEAERRYLRYIAVQCALNIPPEATPFDAEYASLPFRDHINNLVANVRHWHRYGDGSALRIQAEALRAELEAAGEWEPKRPPRV